MVDKLADEGYDLIGTKKIGNTTTSAAVLCALSGFDVDVTVGKGAGLTEEQFQSKRLLLGRPLR